MKIETFYLNITSDQPERLLEFYRDTIGIPLAEGMGPDALNAGGAIIGIDTHSDTSGKAKEPSRMLLDLWVEDVVAEREKLEAKGVDFIRKEGVEFWGGVISTFADPDGNLVQLIQYKAELDTTGGASAGNA